MSGEVIGAGYCLDRSTVGVMSTHGGAVPVRGWRDRFAGWTPRVVTAAGLWTLISIPLGQLGRPNLIDRVFDLINLPVAPSLFTAVLLFALGSALRRRIRFAFRVLLVFQMFAVALGVVAFVRGPLVLDVAGLDVTVHARTSAVLAGGRER